LILRTENVIVSIGGGIEKLINIFFLSRENDQNEYEEEYHCKEY
jgi:hypothetical protein